MPISFNISVDGETLLVRAEAANFTTADVKAYGVGVIQAALKSGATRVLCDETGLGSVLNTLGSYEAAEFVAAMAPGVAKAAIVCLPEHLAGRQFWETVAVNRGLQVRVFVDVNLARAWLSDATTAESPGA